MIQKLCSRFSDIAESVSSLLPLPSGHRAVYIGVHVPLGRQSRRRHRHRGHRHHRKRRDRPDQDDGRESPTNGPSWLGDIFKHMHAESNWLVVVVLSLKTRRLRECGSSSGRRTMMRSTSPTTCSPSWTSSPSETETSRSGKRPPGEGTHFSET